jgi:hypothetical protein
MLVTDEPARHLGWSFARRAQAPIISPKIVAVLFETLVNIHEKVYVSRVAMPSESAEVCFMGLLTWIPQ